MFRTSTGPRSDPLLLGFPVTFPLQFVTDPKLLLDLCFFSTIMRVAPIKTCVADPDPFDTDPDPAFHFDKDPDPAF